MNDNTMNHASDLIKLRGRLQTFRKRCILHLPDNSGTVLLKCPGLCTMLIIDTQGIEVRSGPHMVEVPCEVTGRFVEETVPPYDSVFGDISEITVYSTNGDPIPIDVTKLQQLSTNELADLEYLEGRGDSKEEIEALRQKFLQRRQEW